MRIVYLLPLVFAFACRNNSSSTTDAPNNTGDAPTADSAAADPCMGTYTKSSIAMMRQGTPGCYELDSVVALALTPSASAPKLYVQDAAGGNFSAVEAYCDAGSTTHPCPVGAMVAAATIGHAVTIKGTYIKSSSNKFEEFYIYAYADGGAGTPPAAAAATLADIERGSTNLGLAFQRVTVTANGTSRLVMYDWTPAELSRTATSCPYVFGFGMIPQSAGVTGGMACTSGTAQPAGVTTPSSMEVLFDTTFYKGFTVSSDCRCAKMFSDKEPSATSTLSGTIGGILLWEVPYMATTGFMALAPTTANDAPITNTVAGM